jgi:hypothetical protein
MRVVHAMVAVGAAASVAFAGPVFDQGFEVDTSGWFDGDPYGQITRVASGTNGVASASGSFHAEVSSGGFASAPFTRFDGYRSSFGAGFVAEAKVYLDTGMATGSGFDYSVAASRQDGSHLRDFIFHVTKDSSTGKLLVGGSNNSNFAPREDLENINSYEVTETGWYTLQHVFRDQGGALAVDLNLVDGNGDVLFTETRFNPADLIDSIVGGNRYGWFTHVTDTVVPLDDTRLDLAVIPLPTAAGMSLAGLAAIGLRRRRSASL